MVFDAGRSVGGFGTGLPAIRPGAAPEHGLRTPYAAWLDQDVAYIITAAERCAFGRLQTDYEREQFIERFWDRRDVSPDSPTNAFKEEHYRRMAYANDHFSGRLPGSKTDRGRIFIVYGPPDEIDDHSAGGSEFPFQVWRYRHIAGVGDDVRIEFVDTTFTGEFRMTLDAPRHDRPLSVPGTSTLMEQMGLSGKRPTEAGPKAAVSGCGPESPALAR